MKHQADKNEKEALEKYLLQFLNIEKRYPLLPGIDSREAVAGLMGIDVEELIQLRERFDQNARKAAEELLSDDEVLEWIENIPFQADDTIAVIGDSTTDDLQGWFSVFTHLMELAVQGANFRMINGGVSYDTSSEALRRLHRDVLSEEPDWVIIALGTFDAIRLDIAPGRTLLPLSETWENLSTIADAIGEVTENPVIWITPPPVVRELLEEMELFDFSIEEPDLARIREVIAGKDGFIVDPLGRRMGKPPEAWYYLSDGINPSLSGHINTVKELLRSLATGKTEREQE